MTYYLTNPTHLALLGHVSFGVRSIAISEPFYTAIFEAFGVERLYKYKKAVGYGYGDKEPFQLFEETNASPHGPGTHLAFNAPNRKAVDAFYEAAMKHGGRGDGEPGIRNDYHENYYACFVYDQDGYRLEAVFQGKNLESGIGAENE